MINIPSKVPLLRLKRDLIKHLKQGHLWIFSDCFEEKIQISQVCLLEYKKQVIGIGFAQAKSHLSFRVLHLFNKTFNHSSMSKQVLLSLKKKWELALQSRSYFPNSETNSFRLINGESDGFPGLVIDIYSHIAVIKFDQEHLETIWNLEEICNELKQLPYIECIYLKRRDHEKPGRNLLGELPKDVIFYENKVIFSSNIKEGSKTGFFLDQRDNRYVISKFSKDKSVLNLFSYTGGFSLFAAVGGAKHVTSVDIAEKAILNIKTNWELNKLKTPHEEFAMDVFEYLKKTKALNKKFDLVIVDPPSFAPNQKSLIEAQNAYFKVFSESLQLVNHCGLFAASSCSSHFTQELFSEVLQKALSQNKLSAKVIYHGGQPFDHPYPFKMNELKYLKFILVQVSE